MIRRFVLALLMVIGSWFVVLAFAAMTWVIFVRLVETLWLWT